MLASPKKKKKKRKEKEKEDWSDLSLSLTCPQLSANAQFWLHSAHIPCMQILFCFSTFLFVQQLVYAIATSTFAVFSTEKVQV
jgi:hypothetical protein